MMDILKGLSRASALRQLSVNGKSDNTFGFLIARDFVDATDITVDAITQLDTNAAGTYTFSFAALAAGYAYKINFISYYYTGVGHTNAFTFITDVNAVRLTFAAAPAANVPLIANPNVIVKAGSIVSVKFTKVIGVSNSFFAMNYTRLDLPN